MPKKIWPRWGFEPRDLRIRSADALCLSICLFVHCSFCWACTLYMSKLGYVRVQE